jgi:hypothetical protein
VAARKHGLPQTTLKKSAGETKDHQSAQYISVRGGNVTSVKSWNTVGGTKFVFREATSSEHTVMMLCTLHINLQKGKILALPQHKQIADKRVKKWNTSMDFAVTVGGLINGRLYNKTRKNGLFWDSKRCSSSPKSGILSSFGASPRITSSCKKLNEFCVDDGYNRQYTHVAAGVEEKRTAQI